MARLNNTTKNQKSKRLNYEKRIKIEMLSKLGLKSEAIAAQTEYSGRTVRRELAEGKVELLNSDYTTRIEYSAYIGQNKHDCNSTGQRPSLKISSDFELVEYIE